MPNAAPLHRRACWLVVMRASAVRSWALFSVLLSVLPPRSSGAQDTALPPPTRGTPYAPLGADEASDTVPPPMAREFRAVWVATVANIDWPSRPGLSTHSQKAELLALLDRAQALHLNAVIFQVRPSADALYASRLEPWSYFLTGAMGRAPDPYYDPLELAVAEAHKRGLELHAWFNPYRALDPSDKSTTLPGSHVSRSKPSLVKRYGGFLWMDPGEPDIRRQTVSVVLDVVRRYDIDGVHIDDYFYPYPVRARRGGETPFPDDRSWRAYKKKEGTLTRDDWRRQNVDLLVKELYDGIKKSKPWVKFGISPFGIWRPGYPESVRGFDSYDKLYADSRKWIREGWVDYWTPQLYWKTTAPQQRYADLLAWWRAQNIHGRNMWPGNYTGRASTTRASSWPVSEIIDQIRETRAQLSTLSGNVHFSMDAFRLNRDSLNERLVAGVYAEPALVPPSPWLAAGTPDAPLVRRVAAPRSVVLEVSPGGGALSPDAVLLPGRPSPPPAAPADRVITFSHTLPPTRSVTEPHWWVIRARYHHGWHALVVPASQRTVSLALDDTDAPPSIVVVSAVDHAGVESASTELRERQQK